MKSTLSHEQRKVAREHLWHFAVSLAIGFVIAICAVVVFFKLLLLFA